MTQTEKSKLVGMSQGNYSRKVKRIKEKDFLTYNDRRVMKLEGLEVIVVNKNED